MSFRTATLVGRIPPNPSYELHLWCAYGITLKQRTEMWDQQEGLCAICKTDLTTLQFDYRDVVDHCHQTRIVRGILCSPCNTRLGQIEAGRSPMTEEFERYLKNNAGIRPFTEMHSRWNPPHWYSKYMESQIGY